MVRSIGFLGLLLLLGGCDGGKTETAPDGVDLRPRFRVGDVFEVREEREQRAGSGSFPSEGELLARTRHSTRLLRLYRVEVIEADGPRLLRARFIYRTSAEERDGKMTPDALAGRTYLVTYPFGDMIVQAVPEPGTAVKAPKAEADLVGTTALRMAASLLPDEPVAPGSTWPPGRDLAVVSRLGKGPVEAVSRLSGITEQEGRRFALVVGETEMRVFEGPDEGATLGMSEEVHVDLTDARISSYHGLTEWRIPASSGRRAGWRRFTVDLSLTPR